MLRFFASLLLALASAVSLQAATLTVTTIGRAGADLTSVAVAADAAKTDKFLNNGTQFFYVNNAGATITLTLVYGAGGTIDGQVLPNRTITVTGGHSVLVGPFPPGLYNDANGYMVFTYSSITSVTVAPVLLGN